MKMNDVAKMLHVTPAVSEALSAGSPVVALESTIFTHGMPWPENLEMARRAEEIVRENGAVPATIAVVEGILRIGLEVDEIAALARQKNALKLSRADLAFAISQRRTGGTTVAATMIAAALAGIKVFATGGIGGVHRGADTSFDISADLEELARTPVIVVSAGPKAILDISKTLEVLETLGVPVIGYRTDHMPAFWSRSSPYAAPLRLDTAGDIADFYQVRQALGITGGMLIANPVGEADEIPAANLDAHISRATQEAAARGITGKAVTPFVLGRIVALSNGESLVTNKALVENNARLAAEIAKALSATAKSNP